MKSTTYSQSKQPLDKNQSSNFCQSVVRQTHVQNLKKKRSNFFYHSCTLSWLKTGKTLWLQAHTTFRQRVTRKLVNHALGVVGCTGLMFTSYFTITGDEDFYRSYLMPAVMKSLSAERAHTFGVWLASKGLIPVDIDGDPNILVRVIYKQQQVLLRKRSS